MRISFDVTYSQGQKLNKVFCVEKKKILKCGARKTMSPTAVMLRTICFRSSCSAKRRLAAASLAATRHFALLLNRPERGFGGEGGLKEYVSCREVRAYYLLSHHDERVPGCPGLPKNVYFSFRNGGVQLEGFFRLAHRALPVIPTKGIQTITPASSRRVRLFSPLSRNIPRRDK